MRIFFFGGRDQARLNQTILHDQGHHVPYVFDADPTLSVPWDCITFSQLDRIEEYARKCDGFVVCVASERRGRFRVEMSRHLEALGIEPVSVIHPQTFIGRNVRLGKGLQTYPMASIHDGTAVGDYCIVGLNAAIDHDCIIGDGVLVMNSAAIIGNCTIGEYAVIGINSTVLPHTIIDADADIPAGSVVGQYDRRAQES